MPPTTAQTVALICSLRERALYLRSPHRSSGPSPYEAEEVAQEAEREADRLSDDLFYAEGLRIQDLGGSPYGQVTR